MIYSIRLGTHNSTIRCATTVTPQCGRGRLREMVFLREVLTGSREKSRESQTRLEGAFPWLWRWGRDCELATLFRRAATLFQHCN